MKRDLTEIKTLLGVIADELKDISAALMKEDDLAPELDIKMIARARAQGDKGPLREWNRRQRAMREAERLQKART